ncbi:acyltransferase family protein [Glaciecola petra]
MAYQHDERLDYLDAVRCFALLMGIVFHASLSFMPIYIGWAVMDEQTSEVVPSFVLISHSFRMPLFFLIAGFFSHMSFHRKGLHSFIKSRLMQIGIPLVLGWFLLRPLLIAGWHIGAESMRGEADILVGLLNGLSSLKTLPHGFLVGTHLWFLYYLLLISATVLSLRFLLGINESLKRKLSAICDRFIEKVLITPWFVFIMALPSAFGLWFMQHWGIDTPDKSLIPVFAVSFLYGLCFALGWVLHRQAALFERLANLSWTQSIICIASVCLTLVLSQYEGQINLVNYGLIKVTYMFVYALTIWSLVRLSIGLCKTFLSKRNALMSYITDASYWIYLIHLPIVVFLQIAFAELPLPWLVKLSSICLITFLITLLSYDLLVRASFLGQLLNHKKKASVLYNLFLKKLRSGRGF